MKKNENKIREFLIELEDAEYIISVTFGFVGEKKEYFYNKPTEYSEVFTEKILSNELTNPAIQIEIQSNSKTSNVDDEYVWIVTAFTVSSVPSNRIRAISLRV